MRVRSCWALGAGRVCDVEARLDPPTKKEPEPGGCASSERGTHPAPCEVRVRACQSAAQSLKGYSQWSVPFKLGPGAGEYVMVHDGGWAHTRLDCPEVGSACTNRATVAGCLDECSHSGACNGVNYNAQRGTCCPRWRSALNVNE